MIEIENILIGQATKLVQAMDKVANDNLPEKIAEIVKFHSKGCAVSVLGIAWIPGLGGLVALIINGGFIWTMYARINDEIGLPLSNNILKSLASGIVTNLAINFVGFLASFTVFSIIPGIGSVGATILIGGMTYAITLTAGYIYLKIMTQLFSRRIDPTTLTDEQLKNMGKDIAKDSDTRDVFKKARKESEEELKKDEQ